MKNKKILLIIMLTVCLLVTTGCKKKSAIEQIIEDTSQIKITVDENTTKQVQQGIDSTKGK